MQKLTIDQKTLSHLASAGSITAAKVIGSTGKWSVVVQVGDGQELSLISQRKEARVFRNVDTLVTFLSEMGISNISITVANVMIKAMNDRSRPDRSEAMKNIHKSASYDKWFREQVEIAQNSPRAPLSLEQSNANLALRKAAKLKGMK